MAFFRKIFSNKSPSKPESTLTAKKSDSNIKYECWQKGENVHSEYATARAIQSAKYGIRLSENSEDYPRWLSYECGIKDPFLKYSQLINEHYLERGSFEQTISNKKVSELKEILLAQNIPAKGKKCDLIKTICDYADRSKIDIEFIYFISEKGEKYIKEHKELLSASELKKYMISIDEYYEKKSQLPSYFKMNDIVWNIFNERNLVYSSNNKFGYLRNNQLYMAQFCQTENRLTESLKFFLYTLYYDMCQNLKYDEGDILAPGIVEKIFELKEYYIEKMIDKCDLLYVPFNYKRPQNTIFYQLVNDIFNGLNIDELRNKYKM